jgi:hypothetical protein
VCGISGADVIVTLRRAWLGGPRAPAMSAVVVGTLVGWSC